MSERPKPSKRALLVGRPQVMRGLPVGWVQLSSALVLFSLLLEYGFPLSTEIIYWLNGFDILIALIFTSDLLIALRINQPWKAVFDQRKIEYFLLGTFALFVGVIWLLPTLTQNLLSVFQLQSPFALSLNLIKLFLVFCVSVQLLRGTQRLFETGIRPEMILAGSFVLLILVSAVLLLLPKSSALSDRPISIMDAFFMATSAASVTGLATRDLSTEFSVFGQMVILATVQLGGLGIVTFVAFLSVFSSRTLPVPQMVAFGQIVNTPALSDLKRQIVGIFVITSLIEILGAILIFQCLPSTDNTLARLRWSLFHSVSAFCNAGFALKSNSLESFATNTALMIIFMVLIILGGLGFLTIPELARYRITRTRFFRKIDLLHRLHFGHAPEKLSVQTKMALTITIFLVIIGTVVFWSLEGRMVLKDHSVGHSLLISAFQSVTTRTAGFNSVPIQELQDATLLFMMMLMVIGANPVSTGGGIKTVSFGILLLALRAMIQKRDRVEAFGRSIPAKTLLVALSVFVLYIIVASIGLFLLSIFDPQVRARDRAFEVISALSTVGLSTGITTTLSDASKVVLCFVMFIGRIGPISLVLSVFQSRRSSNYAYPDEDVVIS